MTQIIVDGGGINWCWYTAYELGEVIDGKAIAKKLWSDRFHKFDDRQGAGKHPVATHIHSCSSNKPVLRVYAREMTDAEKTREQQSFDFFWEGWARWCKQYNIDPNGSVVSIQVVHNRATEEKLVLISEEQK